MKKKRKGDKQIDQKSNTEYYWRIRENLIFKEQYWLQVSRLNTTCLFYMLQPSADLTKLRANWRADARIIQNASNKKSGYNRLHSLVVKFMRKVGGRPSILLSKLNAVIFESCRECEYWVVPTFSCIKCIALWIGMRKLACKWSDIFSSIH